MDLDHLGGVEAGGLVQAVDVLRHERVELAPDLEGDEGPVPGVGLGRPGGMVEPGPPAVPPDRRVGHVVLQRRPLLGARVAGPHPVRAPEVGDAAVGADAGAGQHHHPLRGVDPAPHLVGERVTSSMASGYPDIVLYTRTIKNHQSP